MDRQTNHLVQRYLFAVILTISGSKYVKADFVIGDLVDLGSNVNTTAQDRDACLSTEGLTLYFSSR